MINYGNTISDHLPLDAEFLITKLILSRITTPIIMGLVFFLVITPTGLLRRLLAADPLARNFGDRESYRVPSKKAPAKNMERPF